MSIEYDGHNHIGLVDRLMDGHSQIDREVFLEYLKAANRLADVLCTDQTIHHPKIDTRYQVGFGLSNVTIRWSPGFTYTTGEGNQVRMRFAKFEHHDREYPFAETVSMDVTRTIDSKHYHEVAALHGNGISICSPTLSGSEVLGYTDKYIGDIEEFVFAMRLALSDQLSPQN